MPLGRRDGIVEQVRRRLRAQRPLVEHDQTVLALNDRLVGERDRDEVRGHGAVEGDGAADQRRHGGKPGALEEPAPVGMGHAAEQQAVGLVRIVPIELVQAPARCGLVHCSRRVECWRIR